MSTQSINSGCRSLIGRGVQRTASVSNILHTARFRRSTAARLYHCATSSSLLSPALVSGSTEKLLKASQITTDAKYLPHVRRLKRYLEPRDDGSFSFRGKAPPVATVSALKAAVQVYLNFISMCTRVPSFRDPEVRVAAATRYVAYQRMQSRIIQEFRLSEDYAKFTKAPDSKKRQLRLRKLMVPTRDISLMWAADMLTPNEYVKRPWYPQDRSDMQSDGTWWFQHQQMRLLQSGVTFVADTQTYSLPKIGSNAMTRALMGGMFGAVVGKTPLAAGAGAVLGFAYGAATPLLASEDEMKGVRATDALSNLHRDDSSVLTVKERANALRSWLRQYLRTQWLWSHHIGTKYRLPTNSWTGMQQVPLEREEDMAAAMDIAEAAASQEHFHRRILKLGPAVIDDDYIENAVRRYISFLALADAGQCELLVPTLDIDLVWHAHMLTPCDYQEDCRLLLGRLLPHGTDFSSSELKRSFDLTALAWQRTYAEEYVTPPGKRDNNHAASGSSCGSCGWGDHHFHSELQHEEAETLLLESLNIPPEHNTWSHSEIDHSNVGRVDWYGSSTSIDAHTNLDRVPQDLDFKGFGTHDLGDEGGGDGDGDGDGCGSACGGD